MSGMISYGTITEENVKSTQAFVANTLKQLRGLNTPARRVRYLKDLLGNDGINTLRRRNNLAHKSHKTSNKSPKH